MFERESDLVNAFAANSGVLLRVLGGNPERDFTLFEFDSHFGIADLILGSYRTDLKESEVRPQINPNWVAPLAGFKVAAQVRIDNFQTTYCLPRRSALKLLRVYEEAGFLTRLDEQSYFVAQEYRPSADLIVSIEAKLCNWARALNQARRYRRFSDYTFVLMDASSQAPALKNIAKFKTSEVGLISFGEAGLAVHYIPERNPRKRAECFLRLNETIYAHLAQTRRGYSQVDSNKEGDLRCNSGQRTSLRSLQSPCKEPLPHQASA